MAEVEKRTGLEPSSLEALESGQTDPTASQITSIARVLKIPVPWLFVDPEQLRSVLQSEEELQAGLDQSADPVTQHILLAKRADRQLFHLLATLVEHGDPKLLRAAETNLRSLVKETRRPMIPWASKRPGNFDPPDD